MKNNYPQFFNQATQTLLNITISLLITFQTNDLHANGNNPNYKNTPNMASALSSLPIAFRKNQGQWPDEILYRGPFRKAKVSFMKNGLSYNFLRTINDKQIDSSEAQNERNAKEELLVWNILFQNTRPDLTITSKGKVKSKFNYLTGDDFNRHVIKAEDSKEILYKNIYEKIDLKYYSTDTRDLKYDFLVKSGGHVRDIQMAASGIKDLSINRKGELEVTTPWGILIEKAPYSYQMINGTLKEIDVRYKLLNDTTFGFKVYGNYDPGYTLVIDPIVLQWNTYIGDNLTDANSGYVLDNFVDSKGDNYGTGWYADSWETTPGVYDIGYNGARDMIIFKLASDAKTLIFGTYVGGRHLDAGTGITVNDNGEIFVVGKSYLIQSTSKPNNFPTTTNAFQRTFKGGGPVVADRQWSLWEPVSGDVVVLKLNPTGTALEYSTFVGGTGAEWPCRNIEINDKGEAFVSGVTSSKDFPTTTGAFNTKHNGGKSDGFAFKLSADGSRLEWSTYYGGSGDDHYLEMAEWLLTNDRKILGSFDINQNDEMYIIGMTGSNDFPVTPGALKTTLTPSSATNLQRNSHDMFVMKLSADGSKVEYATFLGGSKWDYAGDIRVDNQGYAYICGGTDSRDFPVTAGAYDTQRGTWVKDYSDAFVLKLAPNGKNLVWSTYLGGDRDGEWATSLDITSKGDVFVAGRHYLGNSPIVSDHDFPLTSCALQKFTHSSGYGKCDIFISKISADGKNLLYSSYYGGDLWDYQVSIQVSERINCMEELTMSYNSHSVNDMNFPGTVYMNQCAQIYPNNTSYSDCPLMVRFRPDVKAAFTFTTPQCNQPVQFTDVTQPSNCMWQDGGWKPTSWWWDFGDGSTSTEQNPTHSYPAPGTYKVSLIVGCPSDSMKQTITISGNQLDITPQTTSTPADCDQSNGTATVVVTGNGPYTYLWNDPDKQTTATATGLAPGTYEVTVSDPAGCSSGKVSVTVKSEPEDLDVNVTTTAAKCGENNGSAEVIVSGGSGNYSYLWSPPGQQTAKAVGLAPGSYQVTVKDIQGCPPETTLSVTIQADGFLLSSATSTNAKCNDFGTATIEVIGGGSNFYYKWDAAADNQTTATATGLVPGTYTYKVSDENGCEGTGQVVVEGDGNIEATVIADYGDGCDRFGGVNGRAIVTPIGGQEPFTYQWDDQNKQTSDTAKGLAAGIYNVTVTDGNGCITRGEVIIEERLQLFTKIDIQPSCETCEDGQVTVTVGGFGTPPYTYRWNDENEQTSQTATGLKPGTYIVTVFDDKDCSNTDTITIGGPNSINEAILLRSIVNIYPNPNNGNFFIEITGAKGSKDNALVKIFDLTGKVVYYSAITRDHNAILTNKLNHGIYLVEVNIGSSRITKRIHVLR